MDKRFQTFLRESEYQLDRRQRKRIKKYIKQTYAAKVRQTQEKIQSNAVLPSVDQQRQAIDANVAATAEYSGGQSARPIKQPIATALHEKNEVTRNHGIWKVGRADSENERPGEAEATIRYSDLTEEDAASGYGAVLHVEVTPVERRLLVNPNPRSLPQATHEDSVAKKRRSKRCIPCRQSLTKCILQGRSCEACQSSGKECFFRTDDSAPKPKPKERAVSRKSRVIGPADFRRCIRCRQRHTKCIPSGGNCEACDQADLICSFRPADLEFNAKLSSDHWEASASLQTTFTKTVKDQQPRRHGSVPRSLHHGYGGEANSSSVRSDDPPKYRLDRESLNPTARSQQERSRSNSTAFSWQRSTRQLTFGRQGNSLRATQISPRKLRDHVRIPRVVKPAKEDLLKGKFFCITTKPGHYSATSMKSF